MRDVGNRSQLSLLEADRIGLVGALCAGFAHEINNPLTSVLLNIRSLRKQLGRNLPPDTQPPALRCLDDITTGAERIASNVRALQTLATRSETQPLDLAALVSASLRLAAPSLDARAHVIRQIFPVPPVIGEVAARPGGARDAPVLELRLRLRGHEHGEPDRGRRRGSAGTASSSRSRTTAASCPSRRRATPSIRSSARRRAAPASASAWGWRARWPPRSAARSRSRPAPAAAR